MSYPEMVRIEPGQFLMGSPENEEERLDSEGPQHPVHIDFRFEVGKYPVTFDEWDAALENGGCNGYRPGDAG